MENQSAHLNTSAHSMDDRRRAEEALRLRELAFSLIVESIPVPVVVTTPLGEVEALNRLTLQWFGKTLEELKGWKSSEVVHPDDLQLTIAAQMSFPAPRGRTRRPKTSYLIRVAFLAA